MEVITINAKPREKTTKGKLRMYRKQGKIPGVIYHAGEPSESFFVDLLDIEPLIYTQESHMVSLKIGDDEKEKRAILKSVDFDSIIDKPSHIDFLEVREGEVIEVEVPIVAKGVAEGVSSQGGKLYIMMHKVNVKSKQSDILGYINVDVTNLKLGEGIHLSQIQEILDKEKYEVVGDPNSLVLSVLAPTKVEEKSETAVLDDDQAEQEEEKEDS